MCSCTCSPASKLQSLLSAPLRSCRERINLDRPNGYALHAWTDLGMYTFQGAAATRISLVTRASCLTCPFSSPISLSIGRIAYKTTNSSLAIQHEMQPAVCCGCCPMMLCSTFMCKSSHLSSCIAYGVFLLLPTTIMQTRDVRGGDVLNRNPAQNFSQPGTDGTALNVHRIQTVA